MMLSEETLDRLHKLDEVLEILMQWRHRACELKRLALADALECDWRRYNDERQELLGDTTESELVRYRIERDERARFADPVAQA
jgi:hypothetical protein